MPPASADLDKSARSTPNNRVLVVGEALVDVVTHVDGRSTLAPGGSPANVAVGLGRLGREVELASWIAPDAHGLLVTAHLSASNVALAPGCIQAERTSVATAVLDDQGGAQYTFDVGWRVGAETLASCQASAVLHTGSLAAVLEPGASRVVSLLDERRPETMITYDPNIRPSLMPPRRTTRDREQ